MRRSQINLNREWRFVREDAGGAHQPDYDDRAWQPIGLPHCFDLPYFRTAEFYVGYGWYRRWFAVPAGSDSRRFFLEFDGVFQVAEVFVNGQRVGAHRGGYTGFCIDITAAVRRGNNLLAVRVNNLWDARLAPRAGEHIFSGGIYRDVRLVCTDSVHIPWFGVGITTPAVSRDAATIRVETEVCNASETPRRCRVRTNILDPQGNVVATMDDPAELAPRQTITVAQQSSRIDNPKLWHPRQPNLYRSRSEILDESGQPMDRVESPFGIRCFDWTADRGFFLNGEHVYLRGANAHQDHAGWGIGITRGACERDVRLIKDAGFNFVRGAHYPHHPAFADACDRLGVLFWSECVFWGKGGFGPERYWNASAYPTNLEDGPAFEQSCLDQLGEMIRINRNHPSIIAWSMCNEPFFTYHLDRARQLLRRMVARCRELDPSRPVAIGGAQRGDIDRIGDIAGYNGDGARLFIEPGVPNLVSEYGAISKPPDAFDPFWGEKQVEHFPWRSGEAIWCGFDYGSIAGRQGLKGIVDHQRVPKRSWHWYRQHNLGIAPPPMPVHGTAHQLRLEAESFGDSSDHAHGDWQLTVTVLDRDGRHVNANPPVTLTIESGPGEFPTGRSITFDPATDNPIVLGRAAAALRAYHAGTAVVRASSAGLIDATAAIQCGGEVEWVEGVTRPCPPRPYVVPPVSAAARRALANVVNVALRRPCRASSERAGAPARHANDGDAGTRWESAAPGGWWQVDLEGFYQLSASKITFGIERNWRFAVEISRDGADWVLACDRRDTIRVVAERDDIHFPIGATARYCRITFVDSENLVPQLAEVELFGVLATR